VAGIVPIAEGNTKENGKWLASDWLSSGDERRMAKFTQYAIAATKMALNDAGWLPRTEEEKYVTGVCLGSGIGNLQELYDTSLSYDKAVWLFFILLVMFC
jgi:3-oxoacyl-[acyl-carrier-protein] synthase II